MRRDVTTQIDETAGADDWRWQLRHRLTTAEDFGRHLELTPTEVSGFATPGIPSVAVTPYYRSLMDPDDGRCPVRLQSLPHPEDGVTGPGESVDPLGERERTPVGGLVHRYPDRVVLLVSPDCPVRCRHCNRRQREPREFLGNGLEQALRYLEQAPGVREVILSGGDPLTLEDEQLDAILTQLRRLPQVEVLRVHSRAPVTCPMRVTDDLVRVLARAKPLYVLTQFNHPVEVTGQAAAACARLVEAGLPLANQSVLLRGVNSDVGLLASLSRALLRIRVRPYYLFQLDPVVGSARFRTPVAAGVELVAGLRGRLSGLGIPTYALDAPGGHGKVVVAPESIVSATPGRLRVRTWEGRLVDYPDTGAADLSCRRWP